MDRLLKFRHPNLLLFVFFSVVYLAVSGFLRTNLEADSDRYLNLSLAREASQHLMFGQIPTLEGVQETPNLIFTGLTGLAERVGGERLALWVVPLTVFCAFFCLYQLISVFVPQVHAILIALFALCVPQSATNLYQFSPYALSLALNLAFILALLKERKKTALGLGFFAIFGSLNIIVPVATLLSFFCFLPPKKRFDNATFVLGFFGMIVGLLLNPGTASDVQKFRLAFNTIVFADVGKSYLSLPFLHQGLSVKDWIQLFPFWGTAGLLGGYFLWNLSSESLKKADKKLFPSHTKFVFVLSWAYWGICMFSFDASGYSVALTVVVTSWALAMRKIPQILKPMVLISFALSLPLYLVSIVATPNMTSHTQAMFRAIESIPHDGSVKRVMTCEDSTAKFLNYARTDLVAAGLFDSIWGNRDAAKFELIRKGLASGRISFPLTPVRDLFSAQVVLCENKEAQTAFETDPYFKRLFPKGNFAGADFERGVSVYAVNSKSSPNFLRDYSFSKVLVPSAANATASDLSRTAHWLRAETTEHESPYLFPVRWLSEDRQIKSSYHCAIARPDLKTVSNLASSQFLGVGGFRRIKVFLNGKTLISKSVPEDYGRSVRFLVPLPHALSEKDDLVALVCEDSVTRLAVALSLWNYDQLSEACQGKASAEDTRSLASSEKPKSCLGDILDESSRFDTASSADVGASRIY